MSRPHFVQFQSWAEISALIYSFLNVAVLKVTVFAGIAEPPCTTTEYLIYKAHIPKPKVILTQFITLNNTARF